MSLPSSQAEEEHPSSRPMSPAAATREDPISRINELGSEYEQSTQGTPDPSLPVPKASDRTQLEAKQVRLLDMPPITLDDTMRILRAISMDNGNMSKRSN
uniref:Uncharacterized protein n=1 Tax=Triticum urartu TaxID=4572 RepID=A0A8R7PE67_TRIUA